MRRILIVGTNSYIGKSFTKWVKPYCNKYCADMVSARNEEWKKANFHNYDVLMLVAAIVHRKDAEVKLYDQVNYKLAVDISKKAKKEGIKQFIFFSTMAIYDNSVEILTKESIPKPKTPYAKSKYKAEKEISLMSDSSFKVAVLRPPFVYGKACKGNYLTLRKFALISPIFPNIENQRSMIHIDNLTEFLRVIIDDEAEGVFCPQNSEYICTSSMIKEINRCHGKKIILTNIFNPFIKVLLNMTLFKKIFGNYIYDKELSYYPKNYVVKSFKDTMKETECI